MWTCSQCGAAVDDNFDSCWKCATPRAATSEPPLRNVAATPNKCRAEYRLFRGTLTSWEALFSEAAEFATHLGPERLISISHSEDANEGVVTVWFWSED